MTSGIIALSAAGGVLAFLLCALAAQRVWLPNPVTVRSAHKAPVSRAGGAVLCGVLVASGGALVAGGARGLLPLLALTLAAGLIGLLDDRAELGARTKLVLLAVLAGVAAWRFGPLPPPPGLGWPLGVGYALAALWVLGFVNVFNFMDGLNGVAAGTGLVLLAALAAIGGSAGGSGSPLALLMLGPLCGFAVLNVARGAPFLGDAGSLSLGVLIAGGALSAGEGFWIVAVGAVPFVADAATTLIARARRGANLLAAHNEHAYQRLARDGARHASVAALYASLAAFGALGTAALGPASVWITAGASALLWFVSVRLFRRQLPRATEAKASRSSA